MRERRANNLEQEDGAPQVRLRSLCRSSIHRRFVNEDTGIQAEG